jgi:2-methylcitrate dehydratase
LGELEGRMDRTTEQLVSYAASFSPSTLTEPVRHAATQHLVDSMACAIAGRSAEPARIAVKLARAVRMEPGARVLGDGSGTSVELAAFANTIMVRSWDWNDGMLAKGGGHPSDMVCGILAAGELVHASGLEVLVAMTLSYELLGALGNAAPVRDRGWDQGTFMGVATALGVSRLLGLREEQMGHAVSLALVPNVPLRVTRTGKLSMWKGCATAAAVRNAVFAVLLAREGMTGPEEPFEGKTALWGQVTGPFEVSLPAHPGGSYVVELSHLKQFPAETHSQALLGFVPRIVAWTAVEEIDAIDVEIYWQAYHEIGSDPSRWDPQTRETADHSLPYLLAVALCDGAITLGSFRPERYLDPSLRPLMRKISVRENPEYTAAFRPPGAGIAGQPRARIAVRNRWGGTLIEEVSYAKGHSKNPMSDADINAKLDTACRGVVSADQRERIREAWWKVADADDIATAIATMTWSPDAAPDGAAGGMHVQPLGRPVP